MLLGCSYPYKPPVSIKPDVIHLDVRERTPGTHHACVVVNGVPWVSDGRQILVLDPAGRVLRELELGQCGTDAPIVDMLRDGDQVHVVLEGSAVITVDGTNAMQPVIARRFTASRLGMAPDRVALLDGELVCFGADGAVRVHDRERLVDGVHVASMTTAPDGGWYVDGRRLHRVRGGGYVGTASLVAPSPTGTCAFARNEGNAALLGVLDAQAREADPAALTVAVPGRVHDMHFNEDTLVVVSDVGVHLWTLNDGTLQSGGHWMQAGLTSAAVLDDGSVLAVGEHGRSIVDVLPGGARVLQAHATPGGLTQVQRATGALLATGRSGTWLFEPGQGVRPSTVAVHPSPQGTGAKAGDWTAFLQDDGSAKVTTSLGKASVHPPMGGRFTCLVSTGHALWLGHNTGVLRLEPPDTPPLPPEQPDDPDAEPIEVNPLEGGKTMSVRLGGPVLAITPLVLGRGVAYATAHDGFGMVVEEKGPLRYAPRDLDDVSNATIRWPQFSSP